MAGGAREHRAGPLGAPLPAVVPLDGPWQVVLDGPARLRLQG